MNETRTLTARWLFPVASAPLERGTITIRGRTIVAVEPHGIRTADEDLGNVAIIPGLVNAHTHLDLSGARGLIPPTTPDTFTDWLRAVIGYRRTRTPEQIQADIRSGVAECFRYGTTLIGDIASDGASWDVLQAAQTRAVVFREVLGLTPERASLAVAALATWVHDHAPTPTCRPGISPHAPYSVAKSLFAASAQVSESGHAAMAVHLAETPGEGELLRQRTGPYVAFLQSLGVWAPAGLCDDYRDVIANCPTNQPKLFIHANDLPADTDLPPNSSIVYCPRTHAAFGHAPHPLQQFHERGVRVCLGTDSLASNPDLDMLAEAQLVRQRFPDFTGAEVLRMVTLSGAEALGWANEVGSLEPGKSADLVAVPLGNETATDPHQLLFASTNATRRTMFGGEWRSES